MLDEPPDDPPPKAESGASQHSPSEPLLGFVSSRVYAPVLERAAETIAVEASGAGAAAGGLGPVATALGTVGAAIAAGGGTVLAAETVRAATKGEKTPIDVADDYYHTHFGDLWGWMTGDYDSRDQNASMEAKQRLRQATQDTQTAFDASLASDSVQQCTATDNASAPVALSSSARDEIRRRTIEADNLVDDGVLSRREADEYIRTGVMNPQEASRERRSGGVDFRLKASKEMFARYEAIPTGDTVVYTLRDHAGDVIYVGVTTKTRGPDNRKGREPETRLKEHLRTKPGELLGQASEFRIEGSYATDREAHALEQELIRQHKPYYNSDEDSFGTYQSGHPKAPLPKWADPELDSVNVPESNLDIRIGIEIR